MVVKGWWMKGNGGRCMGPWDLRPRRWASIICGPHIVTFWWPNRVQFIFFPTQDTTFAIFNYSCIALTKVMSITWTKTGTARQCLREVKIGTARATSFVEWSGYPRDVIIGAGLIQNMRASTLVFIEWTNAGRLFVRELSRSVTCVYAEKSAPTIILIQVL